MKSTLRRKLILSYLAVTLIVVTFVIVFLLANSGDSLMELIVDQETAAMKTSIQTYYRKNGSLKGFYFVEVWEDIFEEWSDDDEESESERPGFSRPHDDPFNPRIRMRGVFGLADAEGRAVFPMPNCLPGEIIPEEYYENAVEVKVDGKTVAYIIPDRKHKFEFSAEEEIYLKRSTFAITLAGIIGAGIAILFGLLISAGILKPVRRLTAAASALSDGELGKQVEITSKDEIGQLSQTFNKMSAELARIDVQRKQLTADITHDLSTPIQIISGYMEMLEEESIQLTPKRIQIIRTELEHLRRLVSDLTTLSQVEGGALKLQTETFKPAELLQQICDTYRPIAASQEVELRFETDGSGKGCELTADPGRLLQTVQNLIENALRYTPENGKITLTLGCKERNVKISVRDTGVGIDAEDIPYVFDRFYRTDKSRNANQGKMGLGLSICKALTLAQGGKISVSSEGKGKGTTFELSFPAVPIQKP